MWDHIINIHPSELLNTKTKEFRINESLKKKNVPHNNFFFLKIDVGSQVVAHTLVETGNGPNRPNTIDL